MIMIAWELLEVLFANFAAMETLALMLPITTVPIAAFAEPGKWYAHFAEQPSAWILVIIGIITCGFIGWQSWETRKAAQAALRNTQALINSERPWIMVQVDVLDGGNAAKSLFRLKAFNYGKNPAHVIACNGPKAEYRSPDEELPITPDYGSWEWDKQFLPPRDSLPMRDPVNPWELKMKSIGETIDAENRASKQGQILVIYGLIQYTRSFRKTLPDCILLSTEERFALGHGRKTNSIWSTRVQGIHLTRLISRPEGKLGHSPSPSGSAPSLLSSSAQGEH